MSKGWRNYISPYLLKCEKRMLYFRLHTLINHLKIETKEIYYKDYKLSVRYFYDDKYEIHFNLYFVDPQNKVQTLVFSCTLNSLDKKGSEMLTGDYFQSHIDRKTKEILPKVSFGAIFHEIIRENRSCFDFIKNIYSTSKDDVIGNGYSLSDDGYSFWEKQVANNLAVWIDGEKRFKAILNN